jgi:hypothetical protein
MRITHWIVSLACVASACGGDVGNRQNADPDSPAVQTPSGANPDSSKADTAATPAGTSDRWTSGLSSVPATATPSSAVVTAIRAASHPDFDRLTIEFGDSANRPGYRIEYIDRPLYECGSGRAIHPVGDGWLEIRLENAAAHTEAGQPTLPGRDQPADGSLMLRIYRTCDFEGIVTFVIAVSSPNPYRVLELNGPARIAVDIRH